jgi:hypothetical protein
LETKSSRAEKKKKKKQQADRQTDGDSKGIAVLARLLHTNFSLWRWS